MARWLEIGRLRWPPGPDAKARVIGFHIASGAYVVTFDALADRAVIVHDVPGGQVLIGASSGRTGARVFDAGERRFHVDRARGAFVDAATGSTWDPASGLAVSGPLRGQALVEVPANPAYWFAWRAFYPDTSWVIQP